VGSGGLGSEPFGSGPFGSGPVGLAHRGGAKEEFENSPSAFQRVADMGLRFVETDVRATIDGHAVVFHDATLERTTDAVGSLRALPLARVTAARLGNGDHPLTLAQALARWPDLRFNVDIKSDDAVLPFLRAVDAADAWPRVCAASFSSARLRRLRALAGSRLATSMGTAEVVRLVLGAGRHPAAVAVQVPRHSGRFPVVTGSFVRRAHARGLLVHVWVVDDAAEMEQLLDLGVDGIITDRPSVLREVFRRRGLRP